ncbi:hypothetical protein PENANT_c017G01066 [Penicillium antarcticum]|uniref:Alcohol dehydrogenase-like C-terminal domain-containing protein n=1 Tax=Penicillium antarcticum TaxID=416450 RepID=A0A1V6Q261_9EURO|nr:hypothetical protein PENANT_c017G01066 [Penicillium antarcticum]
MCCFDTITAAHRPDNSQSILAESGTMSTCLFGQSLFCKPAVVQQASCIMIDKGLSLNILCALDWGLQTGAGSIYNVVEPIKRGTRNIAVFGLGSVGATAIVAATHLSQDNSDSIGTIVAIDGRGDRLDLAVKLGATHVINLKKED